MSTVKLLSRPFVVHNPTRTVSPGRQSLLCVATPLLYFSLMIAVNTDVSDCQSEEKGIGDESREYGWRVSVPDPC